MGRLGVMLESSGARIALVVVSVVAALSVGGAFLLGVVLVPGLVLVARRTSTPGSWGLGLLASLLAAEVAWGLTYVVVAEHQPTIWLVPGLVGVATLTTAVVEGDGDSDSWPGHGRDVPGPRGGQLDRM